MAELPAGALTVQIDADIKSFEQKLAEAQSRMEQTRRVLSDASNIEITAGDELKQDAEERLRLARLQLAIIEEEDSDLKQVLQTELKIEKAVQQQVTRRKQILVQFDQQIAKAKQAGATEQQIAAMLAQQQTTLYMEDKANQAELQQIHSDRLETATGEVSDYMQASQRSAEVQEGGFLAATGAVQAFQSKLTAALGVVAGFAAAAALVSGIAKGFREGMEAAEGQSDAIAKADKFTEKFLANIPILNQFAAAGREIAMALGLAADEAKELEEATKLAGIEERVFGEFAQGRVQIAQNEIEILKGRGNILEADLKTAKLAFDVAMEEAKAKRAAAVEAKKAGIQGFEQLKAQADELERQAELQLRISEAAARRANDERERQTVEETNRAFMEAQDAYRERKQLEADIATQRANALAVSEKELEIAKATDEATKAQLENELAIIQAEQEFAGITEEINKRFKEREDFLKKTGATAEQLAENEIKKQEELAQVFNTINNRVLAGEELRRQALERSLKKEEKITKEKKEQLKTVSQTFDTAISGFEITLPSLEGVGEGVKPTPAVTLPSTVQDVTPVTPTVELPSSTDAAREIATTASVDSASLATALEKVELQTKFDPDSLVGPIENTISGVTDFLQTMLDLDKTRNNLLENLRNDVQNINSTSGAFT